MYDVLFFCVLVAPVLIEGPGNQLVVIVGSTLDFTCGARGFPIPSITWFRDGTEIRGGGQTGITRLSNTIFTSLRISMATVNDSGEYHCNVSSPLFTAIKSQVAMVVVQGQL